MSRIFIPQLLFQMIPVPVSHSHPNTYLVASTNFCADMWMEHPNWNKHFFEWPRPSAFPPEVWPLVASPKAQRQTAWRDSWVVLHGWDVKQDVEVHQSAPFGIYLKLILPFKGMWYIQNAFFWWQQPLVMFLHAQQTNQTTHGTKHNTTLEREKKTLEF